ncbi:MAG: hypothetical protein K1X64_19485 [Myxococcaceae bacterium]|nr:hypothetical protein [Myxococcaceae bacterium]
MPRPLRPDRISPVQLEGTDPVIELYKRDVDRSLLREALKLTPDQRLRELIKLQQLAEEVRRAGRATFGN